MRRARALTVAAVLALGLVGTAFAGIAGAGGDLSKKEYLKEINSICADNNDDLNAIFEEAFAGLDENEEPPPEAIEAAVNQAIPVFRGALDDIEALEGPSTLDKKVDKLVDEYRAVVDDIEEDPVGSFEGKDPFTKVDKKAKKLGLKQCAQSDDEDEGQQ